MNFSTLQYVAVILSPTSQIRVNMYTHAHAHTYYTYICPLYIHTHGRRCMFIYIYIYIYIHTHVPTQKIKGGRGNWTKRKRPRKGKLVNCKNLNFSKFTVKICETTRKKVHCHKTCKVKTKTIVHNFFFFFL